MTIKSKNWQARDNRVSTLQVFGTVTVHQTNSVPVLVKSARPAALNHLSLDLMVETQGIGLQAMTEKAVAYTQPSDANIAGISIYYEGELLASIDTVEAPTDTLQ